MARVQTSGGVPDVTPDVRAPDDYQRIQANPAQFGGLIAQGEQQAGAGALKAVQFFGQVAANDSTNNLYTRWNNRLYGDPSKTVIGPDGRPQPDQGFFGLKGRAALDARPGIEHAMDEDLREIRQNLPTPAAQLQFDQDTRRYRLFLGERIGAYASSQANVYATHTNDASAELARTHIANNADDPEQVAHGASDLIDARVKNAELAGAEKGDPLWNATYQDAKREAFSTQLDAIAVTDPARAMRMLDKNRTLVGDQYDNLAARYRARAEHQNGLELGKRYLAQARGDHPYANATNPDYAQAAAANPGGFTANGLARTIQIESGGNPNAVNGNAKGLGQFIPATWSKYGEGDPFNPRQSILATARYSVANARALTPILGRAPTDAELYLTHQQGLAGAAKLLTHPNVRAGDLVGDAAIAANGGDPNAPASAFVSMWEARFNRTLPVAAAQYGGEQTLWAKLGAQHGGVAPTWPVGAGAEPVTPAVIGTSASVASPPPMPGPVSVREGAVRGILDDKTANDNEKHYALQYVQQQLQIEHAAALDQERQQKLIEAKRKEQSDATERTYIAEIYDPKTAGRITATQIAADPRLTREGVERVLGFVERRLKADPAADVSRASTVDLMRRITLPEGDPQKIYDMRPIDNAFFDQHITRQDHDYLERRLKAQSSFIGKREADFIKSVAPVIEKNLLNPMDQSGKQRLYLFEREVDAKVQQYENEKKNPMDLFDPSKPDYMGKTETLGAFQGTLQDTLHQFAAAPPHVSAVAPSAPTPTSSSTASPFDQTTHRRPGETLDQWIKRTGHGFGMGTPKEPSVPMSR